MDVVELQCCCIVSLSIMCQVHTAVWHRSWPCWDVAAIWDADGCAPKLGQTSNTAEGMHGTTVGSNGQQTTAPNNGVLTRHCQGRAAHDLFEGGRALAAFCSVAAVSACFCRRSVSASMNSQTSAADRDVASCKAVRTGQYLAPKAGDQDQ